MVVPRPNSKHRSPDGEKRPYYGTRDGVTGLPSPRGPEGRIPLPAHLEADVTEALRPGRPNVIVLRVDTSLSPAQAAEGLQSRVFLYAGK